MTANAKKHLAPQPERRVLLLWPQGAELLEAAAFIDVFGWNSMLGDKSCSLTVCAEPLLRPGFGPLLEAGRAGEGALTPEQAQAADFAALALPGGFARHGYLRQPPRLLQLLRDFDAAAKPLVAVCTGALLLARAGLLSGRRAATYSGYGTPYTAQLAAAGAIVIDQPLVRDHNIITAQTPAQAVPAALALLAEMTSAENAAYIGEVMGFE